MICFKDMTFCGSDCTNTDCRRNFTDQLRESSRKWWSHDPDNAPVAFSDFSKECKEYKQ